MIVVVVLHLRYQCCDDNIKSDCVYDDAIDVSVLLYVVAKYMMRLLWWCGDSVLIDVVMLWLIVDVVIWYSVVIIDDDDDDDDSGIPKVSNHEVFFLQWKVFFLQMVRRNVHKLVCKKKTFEVSDFMWRGLLFA